MLNKLSHLLKFGDNNFHITVYWGYYGACEIEFSKHPTLNDGKLEGSFIFVGKWFDCMAFDHIHVDCAQYHCLSQQ